MNQRKASFKNKTLHYLGRKKKQKTLKFKLKEAKASYRQRLDCQSLRPITIRRCWIFLKE